MCWWLTQKNKSFHFRLSYQIVFKRSALAGLSRRGWNPPVTVKSAIQKLRKSSGNVSATDGRRGMWALTSPRRLWHALLCSQRLPSLPCLVLLLSLLVWRQRHYLALTHSWALCVLRVISSLVTFLCRSQKPVFVCAGIPSKTSWITPSLLRTQAWGWSSTRRTTAKSPPLPSSCGSKTPKSSRGSTRTLAPLSSPLTWWTRSQRSSPRRW